MRVFWEGESEPTDSYVNWFVEAARRVKNFDERISLLASKKKRGNEGGLYVLIPTSRLSRHSRNF